MVASNSSGRQDVSHGELIEWVCETLSVKPSSVNLGTRINTDLGVAGLDGKEFMEDFGAKYGVDLVDFDFVGYFGDEYAFSLKDVFSWGKRNRKYSRLQPLTVQMLMEMANAR